MNDVDAAASGQDNTGGKGSDTVPFNRFKEVNDKMKAGDEENVSLRAQIAELQAGKGTVGIAPEPPRQADPQTPPKVYSRAELENAVKAGTITEVDANTLWDQQQADNIANQVKDTVAKTITLTTQQDDTSAKIKRYMAARPDAAIDGTQDRVAVAGKFTELVKRGYEGIKGKGGEKTELLALEMAFGPIDALEAANGGSHERDTHQETGGAGGGDGSGDDANIPKDITAKQKNFYAAQINKGIYADWAEVEEELKHQDGDLAKRSNSR
jgi:hypothetical protein